MLLQYVLRTISFDGRSLALFRILLGVIVLADLLDRSTVFEMMYTDRGITPLADLRNIYGLAIVNGRHFSLHMIHGSYVFQLAMFVLAALCAAGLMLGWQTRFFAIASWVLFTSLRARNPVYSSNADVTLSFMLFWAMFLPIGQFMSIDRIRRPHVGGMSEPIARIGSACYLVQICVVYVCAAYFKGDWRNGTALMEIMSIDLLATELGRQMTAYPSLLSALTHSVLYIEALGTMLLFVPFAQHVWRGVCVILFMGLHLGIAATCDIGLFPFISMVSWLPFVPSEWWRRLESNVGATVTTGDQTVALNAQGAGRPAGPRQPLAPWVQLAQASAIGVAIFTTGSVVLGNAGMRGPLRIPVVERIVGSYLSFTKLAQRWSIFAVKEYLARDGWFVIQGTLGDGTEVDILRNASPVDWTRPPLSGERRLSVVWRTYLAAQERSGGRNLDRLARYLNEKQQQSHGGKGFEHIRMVFMKETSSGPGSEQGAEALEFWSGRPPQAS